MGKDHKQEDDFKSVRVERDESFLGRLKQDLFVGFVIHYIWWWIPMLGVLLAATYYGYFLYLLPLLLLYLPSFFNNDHLKHGRAWLGLRRHWIWSLAHQYLGIEVIRTKKLDPERQYLFAFHPHGILILSRITAYGGIWESLFPGIDFRVLGATPMFWLPGSRELCLWLGAVDASKSTANRILNSGKSIMIYPGGSKEIFETNSTSDITLVLKSRKGFVKLALEHGLDLVPVVVYGENRLFHKLEIDKNVKNWFLRNLKIPLLIFWGRFLSWMPLRTNPLAIVYGEPIRVEKVAHPTHEQIDKLHEEYCERLIKLFEEHKGRFPFSKNQRLIIQ